MNAARMSEIEDGSEPTAAETVEVTVFTLFFIALVLAGVACVIAGLIQARG